MFIQIVDPTDTFTWRPYDERTAQHSDTVFTLRLVPDSVQDALRKKHTAPDTFKRGRRIVGEVAFGAFTDACLDYAIVDWTDLYAVRLNHLGEVASRTLMPCTSDAKKALPEWVRAEIVRLCIGKEAGMSTGDDALDEAPDEAPVEIAPRLKEVAKNA